MTVESGDGRRQTMGCNLHQSRKNCRLGKSLVSFRKHQILSVVFPTGTHHNNLSPSPSQPARLFFWSYLRGCGRIVAGIIASSGKLRNGRLSPKTHKAPRQTRSAINYLKLKSPSAWTPAPVDSSVGEPTAGREGLSSPRGGEERG